MAKNILVDGKMRKVIKEVKESCDRCHKEVIGLITDYGNKGYYRRNAMWGEFMSPDENVLCDECMHNDPRYKQQFPFANRRLW